MIICFNFSFFRRERKTSSLTPLVVGVVVDYVSPENKYLFFLNEEIVTEAGGLSSFFSCLKCVLWS